MGANSGGQGRGQQCHENVNTRGFHEDSDEFCELKPDHHPIKEPDQIGLFESQVFCRNWDNGENVLEFL